MKYITTFAFIAFILTPFTSLAVTIPGAPALFETALQNRISSVDTSMELVRNSLSGGETITGYHCFTIDEGRSDSEYVCGTVSSTTVTGLERGISLLTGTSSVTANKYQHRRGSSVKITDYPLIVRLRNILAGSEGLSAPIAYDSSVGTSSFSVVTQLVNKGYVDYVAFNGAGVISSTETARGVVELATTVEQASSTVSGSSGPLVLQAKNATSTYNASTAANKVVVTQNNGRIDPEFIGSTAFGDGRDGNVTISSTTTLTRDMYYNDLTINADLLPKNYRIFVRGTLSGSGRIVASGANGTNATGNTHGTGTTSINGYFSTLASGNGAPGSISGCSANNHSSNTYSGLVFVYSNSNTGGSISLPASPCDVGTYSSTAGSIIAFATSTRYGVEYYSTIAGVEISYATSTRIFSSTSGSGGAGGIIKCSGSCSGTNGSSGAGGGGGQAGQVVFIVARSIVGSFSIDVHGGNGGNGGNGGCGSGDYCGTGGTGGGGGSGGVIIFVYDTKTWSGSVNLTGGTGGTGYTNGGDGVNGMLLTYPISSLLR